MEDLPNFKVVIEHSEDLEANDGTSEVVSIQSRSIKDLE